jgi:hypothetical protein
MTLGEAKGRVRTRTRHVNDTVRLTEAALNLIMNAKYAELRTELQGIAPTLHITAGPALTVPTGDTLSTGGAERVARIERKIDDVWRPVPMADVVEPEQHMYASVAWEERGGCIVLHPEGEVSSAEYGEFRVLYYPATSELTDDAHVFVIPTLVNDVLLYRASAEVVADDGDYTKAKYFEEKAASTLERIRPALEARYGVHSIEGLREVVGW